MLKESYPSQLLMSLASSLSCAQQLLQSYRSIPSLEIRRWLARGGLRRNRKTGGNRCCCLRALPRSGYCHCSLARGGPEATDKRGIVAAAAMHSLAPATAVALSCEAASKLQVNRGTLPPPSLAPSLRLPPTPAHGRRILPIATGGRSGADRYPTGIIWCRILGSANP